jgi:hypothetical protein
VRANSSGCRGAWPSLLLAGDGEQHFNCMLPFGAQAWKDGFAQLGIYERRVARGDRKTGVTITVPVR